MGYLGVYDLLYQTKWPIFRDILARSILFVMIEDFDQHVSCLGFGRSKPRVWTWKMQQVKRKHMSRQRSQPRSPQKVVKSKGILPKMAQTFRLRIYNTLPRYVFFSINTFQTFDKRTAVCLEKQIRCCWKKWNGKTHQKNSMKSSRCSARFQNL